ncbi:Hypothetical predicted protein [Paramuricea clavata]|uniref:Uncharacterized protein n=1 Tax=Paramuricea clavata TaxID=317549 RepID=A0A6S7GTA2_PARCT|nr:Hypothetical predicted protein [Paramuricea clavata]
MVKELNRFVGEYGMHFSVLPGGRVGVSLGISPRYIYRYGDNDGVVQVAYIVKTANDFSFEMTKDLNICWG